jgi:hypothetical protein
LSLSYYSYVSVSVQLQKLSPPYTLILGFSYTDGRVLDGTLGINIAFNANNTPSAAQNRLHFNSI